MYKLEILADMMMMMMMMMIIIIIIVLIQETFDFSDGQPDL